MSDSEAETVVAIPTKDVSKEKKGRKSSSAAGASTSGASTSSAAKRKAETTQRGRKKAKVVDIFGLCDSDIEEVTTQQSTRKKLASSFVNRVATGNQRRVADTSGEYHIDLKVYNAEEAQSVPPEERWKKAIVRLQFSTDDDSKQWECVQKLVREARKLFLECNPTFYSDCIQFK